MKYLYTLIISLLAFSLSVHAQVHKLNIGLDFSLGTHYYSRDISNPFAGNLNLGYEYMFCKYFGLEAGVTGGGFVQGIKIGNDDLEQIADIYKGNSLSVFIAPKLYYNFDYSNKGREHHYLFLETKLKRAMTQLNKNEMSEDKTKFSKKHHIYEIKMGYSYPIDDSWNINFWLGYSSFDFAVVNPTVIDFNSSTPLQLGVGFSYLLSSRR